MQTNRSWSESFTRRIRFYRTKLDFSTTSLPPRKPLFPKNYILTRKDKDCIKICKIGLKECSTCPRNWRKKNKKRNFLLIKKMLRVNATKWGKRKKQENNATATTYQRTERKLLCFEGTAILMEQEQRKVVVIL